MQVITSKSVVQLKPGLTDDEFLVIMILQALGGEGVKYKASV